MRQGKKKHPASRLARFLLFFCQSQLAGLIVAHLRNPRLFSHQPLRAHGFGRTLFAGWCTYAHGILITLVTPARQYFNLRKFFPVALPVIFHHGGHGAHGVKNRRTSWRLAAEKNYSDASFLRNLVLIPSLVAASAIFLSAVINSEEPSSKAVAI